MLLRLISLLAGVIGVFASSSGWDTCVDIPNHGTWATGCTTTACTTSPYIIEVLNNGVPITSYIPYTNYSVVLTSTSSFKGFILNTGVGALNSPFTNVASNSQNSGFLRLDPADRNVRKMTGCPNGLTHVSNTNKRQIKAIWTAPSTPGTGPITFKSIIVVSQNGLNYMSSLVLPEGTILLTVSATPLFSTTHSHTITPTYTPTKHVTASFTPTITSTRTVTLIASRISTESQTPVATATVATSTESQTPVATATTVATSTESQTPVATTTTVATTTESQTPVATATTTESQTPVAVATATTTESQTPVTTVTPVTTTTSSSQSSSFTSIPSSTASFTMIPESPSSSYNGSQYLRTTGSSGVDNNTSIITGVIFTFGGLVVIAIASTFVLKKKKAVSSRNITANISDYVTQNPIETTAVTVSRFSLTSKTKKEFHPLQTIA